MASVHLDFVAPDIPDLAQLEIYEATTPEGAFTLIETVTEIGVYPDYLSEYTTNLAVSDTNWFRIRWADEKGAVTGYSQAVQGNASSLVKKLVDRIQLRAPTVNEGVAVQVAEYVISEVMGTDNPYDPTLNPTYRQLEGMTLLGVARSLIHESAVSASDTSQWVAGLVSMKSGSSTETSTKIIDYLLKEAARALGFSFARIAQMAVPPIAGGLSEIVTADISRLMIEVE